MARPKNSPLARIDALMAAYSLLSITPAQVSAAAQITPQLALVARTQKRYARRSGRSKSATLAPLTPDLDLLESWPLYLSMSGEAEANKVLAAYNSLPPNLQRGVPIEAFCVAAGVSTSLIMKLLVVTACRVSSECSAAIAHLGMPRVVQKSIDVALTTDGILDRQLLAKATGFLPSPKGSQININTSANANAQAAAPVLAPSPESTSRRLAERLAEVRGLPAAPASALDVITSAPAPACEREPITIDVSADDANEEYIE